MNELLSQMTERHLDIYCLGGASLRGEVLKVEGGILYLKDEDGQIAYVAVDKIVIAWEMRENEPRAGFVSDSSRVGFTPRARK